jgi:hypothetical protein
VTITGLIIITTGPIGSGPATSNYQPLGNSRYLTLNFITRLCFVLHKYIFFLLLNVIHSPTSPGFTSERGLMQRQEQIIKLQDDMLDDISKGVDGLKQKAVLIGEEAKIHLRLLDDLVINRNIYE